MKLNVFLQICFEGNFLFLVSLFADDLHCLFHVQEEEEEAYVIAVEIVVAVVLSSIETG